MKKIASVLLALMLALALIPVAALADGTALSVNVPDTPPEEGETFTVTVSISGNPGLCGAQYTLGFDRNVVQCTGIALGTVLSGALSATNENASTGAKVACSSATAKTGDGVLSEYTFLVIQGGDPAFALTDCVLTDESDARITASVTSGDVKSEKPSSQPTPSAPSPDRPTASTQPTAGQENEEPTQTDTPEPETDTVMLLETAAFSDVSTDFWGAEFIERAVAKGLFTGYPDGTFHPDDTISRADFVTVLWRCAGSPEPKASAPFADVPADAYYAGAVAWAKENGYVDGVSAAAFDPAGALQRQAAMKLLYYYHGGVSGLELMLTAQYDASFADSAEIAAWAKAPMYWAYYNGIISGVGGNSLSPQTGTTRAQMAKILVSYLEAK